MKNKPNPPVIETAFRYIFNEHPQFNVDDVVRTTFDSAVQIVKKVSGEQHMLPGFVYTVKTSSGKRKLVHESAVLAYADDAENSLSQNYIRKLIQEGKKDCAWCEQHHLACRLERRHYTTIHGPGSFYCSLWTLSNKLKKMLKL